MSIDKHGDMFSENQIVLYKCPKNFKGCYIVPEGEKVPFDEERECYLRTIQKYKDCIIEG